MHRLYMFSGSKSCTRHACLTWTVTAEYLILVCTVDSLQFPISFYNPKHKEQAHCFAPHPKSDCKSYNKNANVTQILAQNETIFILQGQIDTSINGRWICEHGYNIAKAAVDVTVLQLYGT